MRKSEYKKPNFFLCPLKLLQPTPAKILSHWNPNCLPLPAQTPPTNLFENQPNFFLCPLKLLQLTLPKSIQNGFLCPLKLLKRPTRKSAFYKPNLFLCPHKLFQRHHVKITRPSKSKFLPRPAQTPPTNSCEKSALKWQISSSARSNFSNQHLPK